MDAALQRAVTGYGSETELSAAFHDATLLLFAQTGRDGIYTADNEDGTGRHIPAFTHPDHTPGTWQHWQQVPGRHLAGLGLPVRLNPGSRITLTIPAEALRPR